MQLENITYSGYLLKRSNKPYSVPPLNINHIDISTTHGSYSTTTSTNKNIHVDSVISASQQLLPNQTSLLKTCINIPSNSMFNSDITAEESMTLASVENPVQSALDLIFAASFFSHETLRYNTSPPFPVKSNLSESRNIVDSAPELRATDNTISNNRHISAPIMIGDSTLRVASTTLHEETSPTTQRLPDDFIDPKDGHIWRAKWCVFEDGILYFYKNFTVGNSSEAIFERRRKRFSGLSTSQTTGYDIFPSQIRDMDALGKSPMPRSILMRRMNNDGSSKSLTNTDHIFWEKRVRLDMVGTVRVAEIDYGERSFELLALRSDNHGLPSLDGDDDLSLDNRLILRAASVEEMNEWMFRFHESCAVIMKQLVRSFKEEYSFDPNFKRRDNTVSASFLSSSLKPISNGYAEKTAQNSLNASLSHGHGRSDLHRRRNKSETEHLKQTSSNHNDCSLNLDIDSVIVTEITRSKKYIPPHLRQKGNMSTASIFTQAISENKPSIEETKAKKIISKENNASGLTLSLLADAETDDPRELDSTSFHRKTRPSEVFIKLGGCADPEIVHGSIFDKIYIPRGKSKVVGKTLSQHYDRRYSDTTENTVLWEIGAVSDCGIRDSNEDAYLIVNDLRNVCKLDAQSRIIDGIGVFCIFDGHCGNHTARFASERLPYILIDEVALIQNIKSTIGKLELLLRNSILRLDLEFRELCSADGREWDSGATAIITLVLDDIMAIATLGDSNGVFCYSSSHDNPNLDTEASILQPDQFDESIISDKLVLWREVASVHSPGREDEKQRIEHANGWITTEQEIPIASLLHRMDFLDQDVLEILQRCFSERFIGGPNGRKGHAEPGRIVHISRLCGELAVSRALGDFDFKVPFNIKSSSLLNDSAMTWTNPSLFLPYPENHSQTFVGDLVSAIPDVTFFEVGKQCDEFLILACDGLWDVMDCDDAIRIAKDLLYGRGLSAKSVAMRLAELAIHLGSSDNVTVLVLVFRPTL